MKLKTKLFGVFIIMLCCVFALSGCNLFIFDNNQTSNNKPYEDVNKEENEYIDVNDNILSELAQKYIDISFTVCIVEETTTSTDTESSKKIKSYGSGFIIHKGGFILTNHHVISDALTSSVNGVKYSCYVSQDGGTTLYPAQVLWENSVLDMAIIVCEETYIKELPSATLKDRTIYCPDEEKISLLEQVIAIGNQGSYYASATIGEISSVILREAISDGNVYEHLIQHTAPINHGNSGGALIDLQGNVIGLNTLGDDEANSLFFAVSIYPAIAILDKVVENYNLNKSATEEPTLGFIGTDSKRDSLSSEKIGFTKAGLYVVDVNLDCLIEGLKQGDIIIGMDITNVNSTISKFEIWDNNSLVYARLNLLYSTEAKVKVERGGNIVTLTIKI